jgi:hypothetical protein
MSKPENLEKRLARSKCPGGPGYQVRQNTAIMERPNGELPDGKFAAGKIAATHVRSAWSRRHTALWDTGELLSRSGMDSQRGSASASKTIQGAKQDRTL